MIQLITAAFAAYRLTLLITEEDGPFDMGTQVRTAVLTHAQNEGLLQRGIICPLCVSFWMSWAMVALIPWRSLRAYVLSSLGVAGAIAVYLREKQ